MTYTSKPCPLDPTTCECRVCFLYLTNPEYNRLWGGTGIDPAFRKQWISRTITACVYLGETVEDPATCGCGVAVLRGCAIHGVCRKIGQPKAGESICATCPDWQAKPC